MTDDAEDLDFAWGDGPAIPTDDDAVVRRVKAVAATRPLHDLERNKSSWSEAKRRRLVGAARTHPARRCSRR